MVPLDVEDGNSLLALILLKQASRCVPRGCPSPRGAVTVFVSTNSTKHKRIHGNRGTVASLCSACGLATIGYLQLKFKKLRAQ